MWLVVTLLDSTDIELFQQSIDWTAIIFHDK